MAESPGWFARDPTDDRRRAAVLEPDEEGQEADAAAGEVEGGEGRGRRGLLTRARHRATPRPVPVSSLELTRRQLLGGLGATASLLVPSGCKRSASEVASAPPASAPLAEAVQLEDIAYNLLAHEPERATSLGVDTGEHAGLRAALEDQSQLGQDAYAATLRADLERIRSVDVSRLDADTRTSFEVVKSAYATALDGFALPYGDVAVGSWRNAPYVVIQNVGTYLDMPRFMDSVHPLREAADAEAFDDAVILGGNVPLDVLAKNVERTMGGG